MINYLKAYFEPESRHLREKAFESAREYYKGKHKTILEFQAYQRAYVNAYRSAYAKNKLKEGVV
jgi:hypothetical protein